MTSTFLNRPKLMPIVRLLLSCVPPAVALLGFVAATFAQANWRAYDGNHFRFSYPPQLQLRELSESDVSVSSNDLDVEIAVSRARPKDQEQMVLNAEKHVLDFARVNNMNATFEGWKEMGPDAVLVISHLRSDKIAIDVVSSMKRTNSGVLLLQVMHQPGTTRSATELAARIAETISIKD